MPSARLEVPGSHREPLRDASRAQAVDPDQIIHATVVLRRREAARLAAEPEAFAFRGARETSHYTRDEFAALHGASNSDIEALSAFAHEHGLTVTQTSAARRSVVLSGPASSMQEAFGTELAYYDSSRGRYRGRTGPITVPEELAPRITAVLGLDDRPNAKPHFRPRSAAGPSGFTPVQVAELYGFPKGVDGSGQAIAIIELGGGYRPRDLVQYFGALGIPTPSVTAVSVDGAVNHPGRPSGPDGEVMLDIEVAGAVAPGAHIVVYFAPNTDQGFHDAITTAVHDSVNKPSVISISWGGPEDSWTEQARNAMLAACQDAAAMGVTVTVAAGDDGAGDGMPQGQHVDFPASNPFVLACGGTKLVAAAGQINQETVWNELANNEGATGGGVSRFFAVPQYQASANVPPQPQTNFNGRGVPDVSGDADPVTGYQIRVDSVDTVIGGTSAVAPLWAGLVALLNQRLGKPVGFLNPMLYQIAEKGFHDISSGDNGFFQARQGWDPCTGLGSPDGAALLQALLGTAVARAGRS